MEKHIRKLLTNGNWFWVMAYGLIFAYFLIRYCCLTIPLNTLSEGIQWIHFKQSVTLPLVILLGVVFVHMFSHPIESLPAEGLGEQEKAAALNRTQLSLSLQRRNWMIFAYSFMLVALLVPVYMFGPGWDFSLKKNNDLGHPVGIFVGCSVDQQKGELNCFTPKGNNVATTTDARAQPASGLTAAGATSTDKPTKTDKPAGNNKSPNPVSKPEANIATTTPPITGSAWVFNLGGHVINAKACKADDGADTVCQVRGGLLIPIYVIILALVGGSISLTRRLPEYQKCANPEFISTEKEPRLSQHEFREYLVFQMVQFISAPFLAILAYFLVDPSNSVASVVLAFSAGFASESILLMVRALTEKFTPTGGTYVSGTLSGIVTFANADGQSTPASNAEVALSSSSQVRTLTDDAGFYVLNNLPIGEHGIKVAATGYEPTTGSIRIERAQEIVRQHWSLKKT